MDEAKGVLPAGLTGPPVTAHAKAMIPFDGGLRRGTPMDQKRLQTMTTMDQMQARDDEVNRVMGMTLEEATRLQETQWAEVVAPMVYTDEKKFEIWFDDTPIPMMPVSGPLAPTQVVSFRETSEVFVTERYNLGAEFEGYIMNSEKYGAADISKKMGIVAGALLRTIEAKVLRSLTTAGGQKIERSVSGMSSSWRDHVDAVRKNFGAINMNASSGAADAAVTNAVASIGRMGGKASVAIITAKMSDTMTEATVNRNVVNVTADGSLVLVQENRTMSSATLGGLPTFKTSTFTSDSGSMADVSPTLMRSTYMAYSMASPRQGWSPGAGDPYKMSIYDIQSDSFRSVSGHNMLAGSGIYGVDGMVSHEYAIHVNNTPADADDDTAPAMAVRVNAAFDTGASGKFRVARYLAEMDITEERINEIVDAAAFSLSKNGVTDSDIDDILRFGDEMHQAIAATGFMGTVIGKAQVGAGRMYPEGRSTMGNWGPVPSTSISWADAIIASDDDPANINNGDTSSVPVGFSLASIDDAAKLSKTKSFPEFGRRAAIIRTKMTKVAQALSSCFGQSLTVNPKAGHPWIGMGISRALGSSMGRVSPPIFVKGSGAVTPVPSTATPIDVYSPALNRFVRVPGGLANKFYMEEYPGVIAYSPVALALDAIVAKLSTVGDASVVATGVKNAKDILSKATARGATKDLIRKMWSFIMGVSKENPKTIAAALAAGAKGTESTVGKYVAKGSGDMTDDMVDEAITKLQSVHSSDDIRAYIEALHTAGYGGGSSRGSLEIFSERFLASLDTDVRVLGQTAVGSGDDTPGGIGGGAAAAAARFVGARASVEWRMIPGSSANMDIMEYASTNPDSVAIGDYMADFTEAIIVTRGMLNEDMFVMFAASSPSSVMGIGNTFGFSAIGVYLGGNRGPRDGTGAWCNIDVDAGLGAAIAAEEDTSRGSTPGLYGRTALRSRARIEGSRRSAVFSGGAGISASKDVYSSPHTFDVSHSGVRKYERMMDYLQTPLRRLCASTAGLVCVQHIAGLSAMIRCGVPLPFDFFMARFKSVDTTPIIVCVAGADAQYTAHNGGNTWFGGDAGIKHAISHFGIDVGVVVNTPKWISIVGGAYIVGNSDGFNIGVARGPDDVNPTRRSSNPIMVVPVSSAMSAKIGDCDFLDLTLDGGMCDGRGDIISLKHVSQFLNHRFALSGHIEAYQSMLASASRNICSANMGVAFRETVIVNDSAKIGVGPSDAITSHTGAKDVLNGALTPGNSNMRNAFLNA